MTKKQNELLEKVQELEERADLLTGIDKGLLDLINLLDVKLTMRINAMDQAFVAAVEMIREVAQRYNREASTPRSSSPKSNRCSRRQSTPRAGSSRSSRKKGSSAKN